MPSCLFTSSIVSSSAARGILREATAGWVCSTGAMVEEYLPVEELLQPHVVGGSERTGGRFREQNPPPWERSLSGCGCGTRDRGHEVFE